MTPELRTFGEGRHPVVVIDGFGGDVGSVVAIAAALAPFPSSAGTYYPGLRRLLSEADAKAWNYVMQTLRDAAPFIGGAFGAEAFDLVEASFSMVTTPPSALLPAQRAPHFDSPDPGHLAVLHYLSDHPTSGTAFYRQRETGIERIDDGNVARFVTVARACSATAAGYIQGSTAAYETIGSVQARPDRLVIYQGALLHSGIIPPDLTLSADPRVGRLTANLFLRIR